MKKKASKGTRRAKVRDLPDRRRSAASVKGGARTLVNPRPELQSSLCWIALDPPQQQR